MPSETIGSRLAGRMAELNVHAAEVARRARTSEATISNWVSDKISPDHVKATMLMNIADAVEMDARELLLGERAPATRLNEGRPAYPSQDLSSDTLTLAFQLATDALAELGKQGKTLPPPKLAEIAKVAFELLEEGLPRAKVLRFVLAAAA
ncbi:MAG: helix-turn-helix domain-containing protein [Gammaproteobacteria bacterium]|jgi:transcriptional regulator with XRE-family HTH domain|nr:helix-turn-helix domain-containing protein [Gammaproteobacteria bacterium]